MGRQRSALYLRQIEGNWRAATACRRDGVTTGSCCRGQVRKDVIETETVVMRSVESRHTVRYIQGRTRQLEKVHPRLEERAGMLAKTSYTGPIG